MRNDIILQRPIAIRIRLGEDIHPALPALTIRGSSEIGVIRSGGILDGEEDTVIAFSTVLTVVVLEIECCFGKPVAVCQVLCIWISMLERGGKGEGRGKEETYVDGVSDVKGIDACRIEVRSRGWAYALVERVIEDKAITRSFGSR